MTPLRLRDLRLFERMPLVGNLFPGRSEKIKRLEAVATGMAHTLKPDHLLHRKPGELSGG